MSKIFISYRRSDTTAIAGRIVEHLKNHFGSEAVFLDTDSIPHGADFRAYLNQAIRGCDVVLALIGDRWLELDSQGIQRLDNPEDVVRIELEEALELPISLIPVLIGGAVFPRANQLPSSLEKLSYLHAANLDIGRDFEIHMKRLISSISKTTNFRPPPNNSPPPKNQSR